MTPFKALFVAGFLMALSASADTGNRRIYYCTIGNPFVEGISDKYSAEVYRDDTVVGYFAGKEFSFRDSRPKENRGQGTFTWAQPRQKLEVEVQIPGPYDGGQDTQWGQIRKGTKKKNLNCYPDA